MSFDRDNSSTHDGTDIRIGIAAARYNPRLVGALIENATFALDKAGAPAPEVVRVPGSAELPFAADRLAASDRFDAIVVIGVVIAGDTSHHTLIGESTAHALTRIGIERGIPVINGILVTETKAQAEARAGMEINRGSEFAEAALEMALFNKQWTTQKKNPKHP